MRITVLTVPGCPNASVALARITAALVGRTASVEHVEVHDEAEAARLGMSGSPTVLVDGADPFATAGAAPSLSCRLYRRPDGTTDGAPGTEELRRALAAAVLPYEADEADDDSETRDDWWAQDVLDPVGRAGLGRIAPVKGGLRAVHQAVLRHFAEFGGPPGPAALAPVAAGFGRTAEEVLAELDREDFLTVDGSGRIRAAYPFSAVPTAHRVRITGGAGVWSMCAIDALGIPAMLGKDVVISSADPVTGEPVTVTAENGQTVWEPAGAVVFVGRRACSGPAAVVCCDALNFFAGRASAEEWRDRHPDVRGKVVGQARAEDLGRRTFGPLLTEG
ncbi:organomercurial lyase [Streptomyces sp. SYSU K21746]